MRDESNDLAFTLQATFPSEVLEAIEAAGALFKTHFHESSNVFGNSVDNCAKMDTALSARSACWLISYPLRIQGREDTRLSRRRNHVQILWRCKMERRTLIQCWRERLDLYRVARLRQSIWNTMPFFDQNLNQCWSHFGCCLKRITEPYPTWEEIRSLTLECGCLRDLFLWMR